MDRLIYPLVSIIITLYNIKKEYINECLCSLYNQTYKNIEILIVDDCSDKVDYSYLKDYKKIRIFRNPKNLGISKSVNFALSKAEGEYIVRLGSDDIFSRRLIQSEVDFLQNNLEFVSVCCDIQRFGYSSTLIRRPNVFSWENVKNGKIHGMGYAGGMMFRNFVLNCIKINEKLDVCEDFDFHLKLMTLGRIGVIHEPLYFYRSHNTNIMKKYNNIRKWQILDEIRENFKKFYS